MEIIRSRQNPLAKHLAKLADNRRERAKSQQTILIGTHLIQAALDAGIAMERLLVNDGHLDRPEIADLLHRCSTPATLLANDLFAEIEQAPSSSGIMALMPLPRPQPLRQEGCCLLLEAIQDPGNVGSILRSAAAAGVDQAWLTPGCADAWSPKVLRAAMGAHFVLPLVERADIEQALAGFRGPLMVTSLEESCSLYEADLTGNLILAFGSEGTGASPELLACATKRLRIPMAGDIESLNVAAAAAICLFERLRQRLPR